MFNQILLLIYRLFLHGGGKKIIWMEQYLGYKNKVKLSSDDIKNESFAYASVFLENNRITLEKIYIKLKSEMNGIPYKQCEEILDALEFIQQISATAMWKYNQNVGVMIEEFVRNFDRLDVPKERIRLYNETQKN